MAGLGFLIVCVLGVVAWQSNRRLKDLEGLDLQLDARPVLAQFSGAQVDKKVPEAD